MDHLGHGALGPPQGRYIGPANGPDCLEIANGYGDCGLGQLVLTGPLVKTLDVSFTKQVPIKGRVAGEFRIELLNAFNWINFDPEAGVTVASTAATGTGNVASGSTPGDFEVTGLSSVGSANARVAQIVFRVSF